MYAGTAWQDITPKEPIPLGGQMHVRMGEYTHDSLTVNVVVFEQGDLRVALVSCDLCALPEDFIALVKAACREAHGMEHVLIACTHTHVGPCTVPWMVGETMPWFMGGLHEAIVRAVGEGVEDLEEVEVFAGKGFLEQMGWNRRGLREDGTAEMYWGSWQEGFAGIEGPRDGEVPVIFARRPAGEMKVVIPSFSTHPNCVEGERYYSADVVGVVRRVLRGALGDDVGVVYLTGAAGDTAPSIMENNPENVQPWRGEAGLQRSGKYLGGEILKVIAAAIVPMVEPELRFEREVLEIPMRPWPDSFDPSTLQGGHREFFTKSKEMWPQMMKEESPIQVPVNVLRIGDAAICTNPGELYCQLGLEIKKLSPAAVTVVAELTDGCVGYIPTAAAIARGGYSANPGRQCKLAQEAGEWIVEATGRMLAEVFSDGTSCG
ncbi:MAG: hypothetical protein O2954_08580 [bacterium]|nr:hypothetical protein [bacterium]